MLIDFLIGFIVCGFLTLAIKFLYVFIVAGQLLGEENDLPPREQKGKNSKWYILFFILVLLWILIALLIP